MRVAIVSINYAPEPTGISVYSTGMAEYLARLGWTVTVHTGFPYYPAWKKLLGDEGALHRKERPNGVFLRRNYLYVPSRPSAVKRMLHEASFVASCCVSYLLAPRSHVTIIVSPPLPLGLPLMLLARLKRSRTLFHVQDMQPDAAVDLGMLKPGGLTSILFAIERYSYRLANRVSTISHGMLQNIHEKGVPSRKLFLFRNWANDQEIVPRDKHTCYRAEWALDDKFVVLYSGNMGVKQGLNSLLDAAERLRDETCILFLIVGDGGEKVELQQRAASMKLANVIFQPLQPFGRLGELLATADVCVIPQAPGVKDIVLPSKLGNIMASARPLIVSAPSNSEMALMIKEADCGRVVDTDSATSLADAIRSMAHVNDEELLRFGRNARAFMTKNLGQEAILGEFAQRLEVMARNV